MTKKKDVVWFARDESRPLLALAGIWTETRADRGTKSKPVPGPHLADGFLTTEPNTGRCADPSQGDASDPDHRRRTRPVDARPLDEAAALQRPLPDDVMRGGGEAKED